MAKAKAKRKDFMPKLKKLALSLHCTVHDDPANAELELYSDDGWSWDDGHRQTMVHVYGSQGSYEPHWRQDAIVDALERLECEHPEPIPYKGI